MQRKTVVKMEGTSANSGGGTNPSGDDFRSWAESQLLTGETIEILLDNAVDNRAALSALTPEDLPHLGLKLGQLALLRRLISPVQTGQASAASAALSVAQSLQVSILINKLLALTQLAKLTVLQCKL